MWLWQREICRSWSDCLDDDVKDPVNKIKEKDDGN